MADSSSVTITHEMSPQDRMMRLMQMQGGGGGLMRAEPRGNGALAISGVASLLGGGCTLAAGIVQAVASPPQVTLTATYATDAPELQKVVDAVATMGFASGILLSVGGGLQVIGGGAAVVAGMLKR